MRINIHYKITAIFCVILAGILLGVFSYLDSTLKDYTYQRIKTALTKETMLAKLFLEKDFPGYPRLKEFDEIADDAGESISSRVSIIGLDGKVLGDSELNGELLQNVENHLYRPEVQQALKNGIGESTRFSTTVQKNMLYMAATFGKNEVRGIVRLSLPLSDVETISGYLKRVLLAALLIAFFIAIIISFIAARFISKPIETISTAAQEIAEGNFDKKISVSTNDEISGLALSFNDMAEQVRSKIELLEENKAKLEAVLLSMFDGVMVVDQKGAIILMNETLKKIFTVEHNPGGRRPLEVIRNVEVQEIVDKVLKMRDGVESKEISILLPQEKIILIHATPIYGKQKIEGAVMVFHDVTEIRRLEKVRKDFVANVSHELRTPVSSIKGFAETLSAGALEDKESAREFVEIIESNSDRLVRLIEDLLDLSKIESGKLQLDLKPHSPRDLADKVLKQVDVLAKKKLITLENNISKDVPQVLADDKYVVHVLLNLIDNAIRYTENNGKISVSAVSNKDFVSVEITDTGIGIAEKDIARIFERFYCVDKARSNTSGGTGLGLSIVKHIVEEHAGTVSVTSFPGAGSTFSFTLPKA